MAIGYAPASTGGSGGGTGGPETDPVAVPMLSTHKASADHDTHNDGRYTAGSHTAAVDPHGSNSHSDGALGGHVSAVDPHGDRTAAATHADSADSAHVAATDPHGDRAAAATHADGADVAHVSAADPHGDRAALNAHASQAVAAHAGSAISFDDTGLVVVKGTNVKAALTAADVALSKPGLKVTTPTPDTINNLTSQLWVMPQDSAPSANAITVKRPSHTAAGWGNKNLPYAQGQAFELLSDSPNDATVSTDPANPVLFRIDAFGGVGICHGAHIATGMRAQGDDVVPTQSIWVDPSIDTVGLIMDNPTPTEVAATPAASYMLIRDVRPTTAYTLVEVKADGTLNSNKALVATPRTNTDVPLTVKATPNGLSQASVAEFWDFSGKRRIAIAPNDGTLKGVADDGTTSAFTLTPLDIGNVGYRAIIAAVNVNTIAVGITSPAAYTKDHIQVIPSGGAKWRINKAGYEVGKMAAAPALADLADGEYAFWLDTVGNAFKISARVAGVLKTGTVAVA